MIRLSDIRITTRLVIAIAIPLLFFAILAGYDLFNTWRVRAEMVELGEITQGATKISLLVHHLQRERGASAIFLSSKGAQQRAELPAERKHSDEQRQTAQAKTMDEQVSVFVIDGDGLAGKPPPHATDEGRSGVRKAA
jgi:hypothetical protein